MSITIIESILIEMSEEFHKIWVVGAKPEATFPNSKPDIIYAANGAISRVQKYNSESNTVGVISSYILESNHELPHLRHELDGCDIDELLVARRTPYNPDMKPDDIGLNTTTTKIVNERHLLFQLVQTLGVTSILKRIWNSRGIEGLLKGVANTFLAKPIQDVKLSTGMLSLLLSLRRHNMSLYYIIGIGLKSGEGHHYSDRKKYSDEHIMKDRWFISRIVEKYKEYDIKSDNDSIISIIENAARRPC